VGDVLAAISELDDHHASVLVVGHEPTWSSGVEQLTGADVAMVTAAVACVELPVATWRLVARGDRRLGGRLLWLLPPRLVQKLRD
jgi:phosphohistidine phosphatase